MNAIVTARTAGQTGVAGPAVFTRKVQPDANSLGTKNDARMPIVVQ
jgi:hypothetical protein